jgi:hypothetical protein
MYISYQETVAKTIQKIFGANIRRYGSLRYRMLRIALSTGAARLLSHISVALTRNGKLWKRLAWFQAY